MNGDMVVIVIKCNFIEYIINFSVKLTVLLEFWNHFIYFVVKANIIKIKNYKG